MSRFAVVSYGIFRVIAEKGAESYPDLQKTLYRAHVPMRASMFLAAQYAACTLAALAGFLLTIPIAFAVPGTLAVRIMLPLIVGLFFGILSLSLVPLWLQNQAREKAKELDENLPHALNYMLALANAGMPPTPIWGSLAKAKIFGAVAEEAALVYRDLDLFGYDILKALRIAQERTGSKRFHDFLQGAISAFQSGVELGTYLKQKGAQYQHEMEAHQAQTMDTMGVMAEAFLVVVVAAPLFLIILLTVMAINQGEAVIFYGFILALVFIPLAQVMIGAIIKSMNPGVWT